MEQPLWKRAWRILSKLNIELPYDPAILLLGIYPDKTIIQKDTHTPMFTATLFTIVKTWKKPKCPSVDDLTKKMWYIYIYIPLDTYTVEYYSTIKKIKIMPCAAIQMQPDILTYKTETDSKTERKDLRLPRGRGREWAGLGVWG